MPVPHVDRLDHLRPEHLDLVRDNLADFMCPLFKPYYPGFGDWYRDKIIPGFSEGTRAIHLVQFCGGIGGVSVVKPSAIPEKPNKINSLIIIPETRGYGIGRELMEATLGVFCRTGISGKVILTVSEERVAAQDDGRSFLDFLYKFDFKVIDILSGRYRPGKKEYILEGPISKRLTV